MFGGELGGGESPEYVATCLHDEKDVWDVVDVLVETCQVLWVKSKQQAGLCDPLGAHLCLDQVEQLVFLRVLVLHDPAAKESVENDQL